MNKKTIIQLVIIIGAFLGAGLVLYNGLFKGSVRPEVDDSMAKVKNSQAILPYGETLDFTVLKKQDLLYKLVEYPKLDPSSDFGISEDDLITAPKAK